MIVDILPAWGDNYIYLMTHANGQALVVDPCDAAIVGVALHDRGAVLSHVLATHHHSDHIAGVPALKATTGCRVLAPESQRIAGVDQVVTEGENISWQDMTIKVLATPGHTRTSVCYLITAPDEDPILFTGDTLFVGGCGRLFECDGVTLWHSLQKIVDLPDATRIYCGHEYTRDNLAFARSLVPDDTSFQVFAEDLERCLNAGGPSVPSPLAQEKQINIFLRSGDPRVQAALGETDANAAQVFTELRQRKDCF